jgi:hypothetical protein
MIPLERLPGFARWGRALDELLGRSEILWVHGESGCGASTVAAELAARRSSAFLDDGDRLPPEVLAAWMRDHPRGVVAAHEPPVGALSDRLMELRIPALQEEPESVRECLAILAQEEGLEGPLPPRLGQVPCPGNLRGLRNRLVRWRLLGQLPEDIPQAGGEGILPLEADDLATNLHVLERLLLHRALRRSYGNRVEAARRLGVSRRQLYLLVARHGDPVRGEAPTNEGPKRLGKARKRQNSSPESGHR